MCPAALPTAAATAAAPCVRALLPSTLLTAAATWTPHPAAAENTTIIDNTNVMVTDYPDAGFGVMDSGVEYVDTYSW